MGGLLVIPVFVLNLGDVLQEKTGGKIIYSRGGSLFLFRGRNYNYRTRPRFPLMLWKPVTPVYPRLIQNLPEGLTQSEASEMRKTGHNLPAICKLGKNGVYSNLVENVREAFEECDLVRINCEGMNGSDFRKIGAKLKDLVPCVLMSFQFEHILIWRGRDWKSSFPKSEDSCLEVKESETNDATTDSSNYEGSLIIDEETSVLHAQEGHKMATSSISSLGIESVIIKGSEDLSHSAREDESDGTLTCESLQDSVKDTNFTEYARSRSTFMDGVTLLWKQAIENGSAIVLDNSALDANIIYSRSVSLAKAVPHGPVFKHGPRKVFIRTGDKQDTGDLEAIEVTGVSDKINEKKSPRKQILKGFKEVYPDRLPHGSLGVDELAKLLA
ncbi:hypothetical protein GIB67_010158 [Kingdonia uniflora]|uniref:CRM domain-containing protein n=1 Tax=Kingdonia uniflora TaxID=39325 RepID=A0A7J7NBF6_9MAGN|nr:hypothetical protein GIB67_010158 [Kingdonia uniflora]